MEDVFERKVGEKKSKLEASQQELEAKLRETKEKFEAQKLELETKRQAFLEEKRGKLCLKWFIVLLMLIRLNYFEKSTLF